MSDRRLRAPRARTSARPDGLGPVRAAGLRSAALALALTALLAGWAAPCRADLQLQFQDLTATSSTAGYFDITVTNTDLSSPSVTIGGFDITVTVGSPVTITAATTTTGLSGAPTYIFAGNSFADSLLGGSIAVNPLPDSYVIGDDIANSSGTSLAAGQTLALGRIFFDGLPVGTVVPLAITNVDLSDEQASSLSLSFVGGYPVGSLSLGPEPSTMLPVVMCLIALAGRAVWSRGRQTRPTAAA